MISHTKLRVKLPNRQTPSLSLVADFSDDGAMFEVRATVKVLGKFSDHH